MRGNRFVFGAVVAGLVLPGTAGAVGTGTVDSIKLPGAAESVVLAPDGSIWVSLFANRTVARIAPDGTVTESADLGGATAGLAVAEDKVWVAVTSAKKVVRFDPGSTASSLPISTPGASCGPVAIAGTGNGMVYASLPHGGSDGSCATSAILPISATGAAAPAVLNREQAFDLLAARGVLWVPDNATASLKRVTPNPGLTVGATYPLTGSAVSGLGVGPDGSIVVSLFDQNSVARIAPDAQSGTEASVFATGIPSPVGVGSVGGSLFVAGSASVSGSPTLRRYPSDGSIVPAITPLAGSRPFDVSPGPDGTVLFTDPNNARLIRFTSRPPRAATGGVAETTGQTARVDLSVNAGGNTALTTVEFGPTPSYGSTAVAVPTSPGALAASGVADVALRADLKDLQLGTTYHYRAVVVTAEGTAYGEDRTFTTPATPSVPGGGSAKPGAVKRPMVGIQTSKKKGAIRITKIRVTELTGGERITVTCAGKGCPSRKKDRTFKVVAKKAGSLTVAAKKITASNLGKRAKVTVQVVKAGTTGAVTTVSVSGKKRLTIKEQCLAPGAKKPSAC